MKNTLRIDHGARRIIMDRTFAKYAANTRSNEYAHLQQVRKDYPDYSVVRKEIKRNQNKNTYRGLTYDYMYHYISENKNLTQTEKDSVRKELEEMIQISRCQALRYRYPVIKKWFLDKFPEIRKFAETGLQIEVEEQMESICETIADAA